MGDLVANVIQKQFGGNTLGAEKQMLQQSQNGSKFENVLQQNNSQTVQSQTNPVTDSRLENMRVDLMQRYQQLPDGVPKVTAIFPEFIDTKTRMSNFKNVLNQAVFSVGGETPQAQNVQGKFSQVENEWLKLENVMTSDKELSQGELIGLQARLYQVSQHIDVLSKVVDQMTSGVKTILNTNV
jgi:thymidylate synthase